MKPYPRLHPLLTTSVLWCQTPIAAAFLSVPFLSGSPLTLVFSSTEFTQQCLSQHLSHVTQVRLMNSASPPPHHGSLASPPISLSVSLLTPNNFLCLPFIYYSRYLLPPPQPSKKSTHFLYDAQCELICLPETTIEESNEKPRAGNGW